MHYCLTLRNDGSVYNSDNCTFGRKLYFYTVGFSFHSASNGVVVLIVSITNFDLLKEKMAI